MCEVKCQDFDAKARATALISETLPQMRVKPVTVDGT